MNAAISRPRYLTALLAGSPPPAAATSSALAWLKRLRGDAVDRVGALTVPTTRDEDWRFTDVSPLAQLTFQPAAGVRELAESDIAAFVLPDVAARLVFVDGRYAPQLSFNDSGIVIGNLMAVAAAHPAQVEPHLAQHARFHDSVFTALNTAFLQDGAVILVPRDAHIARPVHVLFMATQPAAASYPRCLLAAGAGSSATFVEDYVALTDAAYLADAVTEIAIAENARVSHVRVQRESRQSFHVATCTVGLARASRFDSVSIAHGARLSRYDLNVLLDAPGAECTVDGLALIGGEQLADTHTSIAHAQPEGRSRQLHKCIVDGAARAVFNGKIMVRRGAQHTDSAQSSRNLLLSPRARVDTKPQLEIFADDVKCAHGATVGQLDADAVFYLRSRGLSEPAARDLLTYAFGAEVIARIPVAALRDRLGRSVLEQTSH